MDHEKEKKTCQNQKIGQGTLHIPLSKPCWCRWRVSIQRSYRAPDQPCKPSRRLYLGLPSKEHEHIADVPQKLPVFTVPKKSRDLGSFAMWSPQIIHFGVQKEFRKTANHFFKGLFQLLNKTLRQSLPNMDSPQDLPTYSCPWPTWNPSTSGSPVPNSCKTAESPNHLTLTRVSRNEPYMSKWPKPLHWALTLKKCFIKFFSDTWNSPREEESEWSLFGWTIGWSFWGGWLVDDISQKSRQAKSHLVLRFLAIYIYTHCTQYLTQYYYHINYLITAIMKSIYKNNNEKFWPPFSHLFKLPLPNFPFQKSSAPGSQSSLQHLVLSTWLVHIPWVCKARPSWRMEQSPPCLCNLARTGSRVCGLRFGKRHVIWDKYDIDIDIKRYSANGLEVLVFWTLYRC